MNPEDTRELQLSLRKLIQEFEIMNAKLDKRMEQNETIIEQNRKLLKSRGIPDGDS